MAMRRKMKMEMMMLNTVVMLFRFGRAGGNRARGLTRRTGRRRLQQLALPGAAHLRFAARAAAPLSCGNAIGASRPIVWHGWPGRLAPPAGLAAGLPATYGTQGRATKSAILSQIATGSWPRRSWRPKSLSTRRRHRWLSLGHQGGPSPSITRARQKPHSGSPTPSGMYMLNFHAQHQ